ncbi:MAG: methylmalonyl Co-A mutase-associated GTPase MeaB [Pseudomonadota bacterium]
MSDAQTDAAAGEAALQALRAGGKREVAKALARLESWPDAAETWALLDAAHRAEGGHVIGLTGPPGVGKSSLVNRLIAEWRGRGLTVAVLAVDPSSRRTRGALLGDRTRIETDPEDRGVFVRSMAARDRLGGLAEITWPCAALMRALFDRVLIETVGVGQSETEIADLADTVVLGVQPASGDALQFMKSGVMETPHVLAVTKADLGGAARQALADLKGALTLAPPLQDGSRPVALACSSQSREGVSALIDAVEARAVGGTARADRAARRWAELALRERFGRRGLAAAANRFDSAAFAASPYSETGAVLSALEAALNGALQEDRRSP